MFLAKEKEGMTKEMIREKALIHIFLRESRRQMHAVAEELARKHTELMTLQRKLTALQGGNVSPWKIKSC